jgi:ABC-2 type transport system permease protein
MTGAFVVARRELRGLFMAPFTWIVLLVVLFINGLLFASILYDSQYNVTVSLNGAMTGASFWLWMIFLPALLSMRLVAEESRSGTLEYLLTAPVSDAAVVVGKFLAATGFLAVIWSSSLVYAVSLDLAGGPPDWPAVIGTWFGTILVSGLFVSIGMLAATSTSTPLLAAFLSMVACLMWMAIPFLAARLMDYLVPLLTSSAEEQAGLIERMAGVVSSMDALRHFSRSFQMGILDSAEVIFFLTWTSFFLFLTARSIEARRWRG